MVRVPLGMGGCRVHLTQISSPQDKVSLETTITWKQRELARPLLDVQFRNVTDDIVMAVAVTREFRDAIAEG